MERTGFQEIEDFITKTKTIDDIEILQNTFTKEITFLGFDKHTCLSLVDMNDPPPNSVLLFSFPEKWVEHYKRQEYYKDDVVLKTILKRPTPYVWKDLNISDRRNQQIFSEAKEFGVSYGMTVPISHYGHYPCSINIAGSNMDIDPLNYHVLHLMALHYYQKVIEIKKLNRDLAVTSALSLREAECLLWVSKGKSDQDIGDILSISPTTVREHMTHVRAKFKVRTRAQALVIAISCGIILP